MFLAISPFAGSLFVVIYNISALTMALNLQRKQSELG
jgi:hypothetical protein